MLDSPCIAGSIDTCVEYIKAYCEQDGQDDPACFSQCNGPLSTCVWDYCSAGDVDPDACQRVQGTSPSLSLSSQRLLSLLPTKFLLFLLLFSFAIGKMVYNLSSVTRIGR
jgi:hypothetical protein